MSETNDSPEALRAPHPVKPLKRSRWTMIAIVVVSLLPITGAYFVYFTGIGVPEHTVNAGLLLTHPVSLVPLLKNSAEENAVRGVGGSSGEQALLNRLESEEKWRLLLPLGAKCDTQCQENLYTTRQVHIRLSEKSGRVERYAVNLNGAEGDKFLDTLSADHPRLKRVTIDQSHWQEWLVGAQTDYDFDGQDYYLLVDQEGFAMMLYTSQTHGNLLLKDLKRALKYSIDYQ
ncbi:MAG: hypothetical protein ACI9Y1_001727 [Lentisphaeria bacterium]|jgi:hypothetical protein